MKLELIKEQNAKGEDVFWIVLNGAHVDCAHSEEKANEIYQRVKNAALNKKEKQILKSEEI